MEALDTNILVRLLIGDDANQYRKADKIISASGNGVFLITDIVLCELIWVLDSVYDVPKSEIVNILTRIFRTRQFQFENIDILWHSLRNFEHGKADFSDYLIGRKAREAECVTTHTFDKSLKGSPLFTVH